MLAYEEIPGETDRLVRLVDSAGTELGIMLVYDCGFLPCLFDEKQRAVLRAGTACSADASRRT